MCWRLPALLLEEAQEGLQLSVAYGESDLGDGELGGTKKMTGTVHTAGVEVGFGREASVAHEQTIKIGLADSQKGGDVLDRKVRVIV